MASAQIEIVSPAALRVREQRIGPSVVSLIAGAASQVARAWERSRSILARQAQIRDAYDTRHAVRGYW